MCNFLFLRFYNFIKRMLYIYIVFFKKLQPLFLKLVQIFATLKRTDASLFKHVINIA